MFRLSQEEYQTLKHACETCGARNVSDFTRSELLAVLPTYVMARRTEVDAGYLQQRIAALQKAVEQLIRLLENTHRERARDGEPSTTAVS